MNVTLTNLILFKSCRQSPLLALSDASGTNFYSLYNSKFTNFSSNIFFTSNGFSKKLITASHSKFSNFLDSPIYLRFSDMIFFTQTYYEQISQQNKELFITDCYFDKCNSRGDSCGGSIYVQNANVFIDKSIFDKSRTKNCGGALYVDHCPNCTVTKTLFQMNNAFQCSGTIHSYMTFYFNASFMNITLDNAELKVGSISLISTDSSFFTSCIFCNNSAPRKGIFFSNVGITRFNMTTFAHCYTDSNIVSNYLSKVNLDNSIMFSSCLSTIDWHSNLRCIITGTWFNVSQSEAFTGKKSSVIIGPKCAFEKKPQLSLPTMYGTLEMPDPTEPPSPTVPLRTKVVVGKQNQASAKHGKKDTTKIDIILDNQPDEQEKEEGNNNNQQIIVVQKQKIPPRTPSPTLNRAIAPPKRKNLFDTQQIALVGGLVLIIAVIVVYRFYRQKNLPDPSQNVFDKLEKNSNQLPRGMRYQAADDFFD